ncbi:MAG: 3'-5' exonuclease [Prochlorococcaceae cyanobacterium]|jgi:DNA polymerase-3 subunit epsilon
MESQPNPGNRHAQLSLLELAAAEAAEAAGRQEQQEPEVAEAAAVHAPAEADEAVHAAAEAPEAEQREPEPQEALPTVNSAPGEPACVPEAKENSLPACPERLLILDTETTALSPREGHCIEVGAVLFHVPSRSVLSQVSFLLPCPDNPAQAVNGIDAAVSRLEQPWQAGLQCFLALVEACDALLAHNAAFDRQWFGQGPLPPLERPWICSMDDIRWPAELRLRTNPSVSALALAHGVPVWAAHRALTDCIYLAQVFERCRDLEGLLAAALEPRHLYRARLDYAERHRAKEAGFRWNDPVPGAWTRRLSAREAEALDFPVQPVDLAGEEQPSSAARRPVQRRSA